MASSFEILPAIDLVGGSVVRLEQGDFDRQTWFGNDPVALARGFGEDGARWLHVVDLDGARSGEPRQLDSVRTIVHGVGDRTHVEVSGGLRSIDAIEAAIAVGARRVVLGTAALRGAQFVRQAIEAHGSAGVVVALDVRDGQAVGEGWRQGAPGQNVKEAMMSLVDVGVTIFEVTAIDRDGLLGGPDLELLGSLGGAGRSIIASGGIASVEDILAVREIGCAGAIVGRALYKGDLTLAEALEATRD